MVSKKFFDNEMISRIIFEYAGTRYTIENLPDDIMSAAFKLVEAVAYERDDTILDIEDMEVQHD